MSAQPLIDTLHGVAAYAAVQALPDFGAVEARKAQARVERELDNGEAFEALQEELAHDMRKGLKGLQSWLATTVYRGAGLAPHERLGSVPEEVLVALDDMVVLEAFMHVLKFSECPRVQLLRDHIVRAYVRSNADNLFEARSVR